MLSYNWVDTLNRVFLTSALVGGAALIQRKSLLCPFDRRLCWPHIGPDEAEGRKMLPISVLEMGITRIVAYSRVSNNANTSAMLLPKFRDGYICIRINILLYRRYSWALSVAYQKERIWPIDGLWICSTMVLLSTTDIERPEMSPCIPKQLLGGNSLLQVLCFTRTLENCSLNMHHLDLAY